MRTLRYFLLVAAIFFTTQATYAQMIEDPTTWKTEVKMLGGDKYQLIFHLALKTGWHVYVKTKNMDESLIVPSFTFDKNDAVTVTGETMAKGVISTMKVEGMGMISMYTGKVIYTQDITAKKGTKITGSYTYQTCNESTCLPPKTKKFSVVIK